ncbi:MAG: ATP-dependent helicase [candidate division WOR-3 bacterium]|nr:ATP-dependent helicase [candidate division WOR-3 bacterium]
MPLTEEQKDIVESIGKPMVVLAGPGTGKTEVLAHRILHLLKQILVSKEEIIGITFTTKAAEQMKKRLTELGLSAEDHPLICTLHSLSVRMLKDKGNEIGMPEEFTIGNGYESYLVLGDAILDVNPRAKGKIKQYSNKILLLKANRKRPDDLKDGLFKKIYTRYQELLWFHSALDFQDLIMNAYKLLEISQETRNTYHTKCTRLLVDEFQDINRAEYSLIQLLADKSTGLFVVGDDKQSIYGWRGGDPKIILGFTNDFVGAIQKPMTICFRCPEKIIRGADEFIKRKSPLNPQQKDSEPIYILDCKSDVQEAKYISQWIKNTVETGEYEPKDIAILYRGGDIADKIAASLAKANIRIIKPSLEETKHVREFIACLRLIIDRRDSLALRVCLASKLAKGIGNKAIKKIRKYAEANDCSFWNALTVAQNDSSFKRWHKPLKIFNQLFESLSVTAAKTDLKNLLWVVAEKLGYKKETRIVQIIKKSETIPRDWSLYNFIQNIRGLKGEKTADPRESGEGEDDAAVLFITTHSVKGLQRKVVFVLGMEKGNFPKLNGDIEEQKRLFYVAMTRAKEKLFLCYAKKREGKAAQGYNFYDKSPFIFDIPNSYRKFIRPNE